MHNPSDAPPMWCSVPSNVGDLQYSGSVILCQTSYHSLPLIPSKSMSLPCSFQTPAPKRHFGQLAHYLGAKPPLALRSTKSETNTSTLVLQWHCSSVPTSTKIMILGWWNSDGFLAYIWPQVLKWTSNMSRDMTRLNSFLDMGADRSRADTVGPCMQTPSSHSINGSFIVLPQFHLRH
jgi:hypothetical protein